MLDLLINIPEKAGQTIRSQVFEGRYKVSACHTRFERPMFFLEDLDNLDDLGLPEVLAITDTYEEVEELLGKVIRL